MGDLGEGRAADRRPCRPRRRHRHPVAAYMGGVAWRDIAASGLLPSPVDAPVLERLDALFAIRPTGYCGTFF